MNKFSLNQKHMQTKVTVETNTYRELAEIRGQKAGWRQLLW